MPSVLWHCWLGSKKGIRKKTEWWDAGMVICLGWGADLHMAQMMLLLLTVSCFSKIQIVSDTEGRTVDVCVCVCVFSQLILLDTNFFPLLYTNNHL